MNFRDHGKGIAALKALIVTADDFGVSLPVNEAVEDAHRHGILSAASLMVGAPAFDDAVARASRLPTLGVGIHLTMVDGRPVLPPEQISGLVGLDGRFFNDPVRLGTALYFSGSLRRQAQAEVKAQFDRFAQAGLPMDHINGHQHFHMHPVIARIIASIAPRFGSPPVRIPYEPFARSYRAARQNGARRLWNAVFFGAQSANLAWRMKSAKVPVNDMVFGINDSGAMVEDSVLKFLDQLPDGVCELYCHPATKTWAGVDNLPLHYKSVEEYRALIAPAVIQKLASLNVRPVTFRAAFASSRS